MSTVNSQQGPGELWDHSLEQELAGSAPSPTHWADTALCPTDIFIKTYFPVCASVNAGHAFT